MLISFFTGEPHSEDADLQTVRPFAALGLESIQHFRTPEFLQVSEVLAGMPVMAISNEFDTIFGGRIEANVPASRPLVFRNCADVRQSCVDRVTGTHALRLSQLLATVRWLRGSNRRGLISVGSTVVGRAVGYGEMTFLGVVKILERGIALHAMRVDGEGMWPKDTYFVST